MGADYIVTGSINQSCVEAGTSKQVKDALSQASYTDVSMAPSADMFEMGVKVQVLKRGTMFPMRAQKLYDIYSTHQGIEELDPKIRQEIEEKIFQRDLNDVWEECVRFFSERDPSQLERAEGNPKRKMALIFRWYLGLATQWGIQGVPERSLDYQVWCGPTMGAFNDWVRGTKLENPDQRHVVTVAAQLMRNATYLYRIGELKVQGVAVPIAWQQNLV
jgi:PfaD family protein